MRALKVSQMIVALLMAMLIPLLASVDAVAATNQSPSMLGDELSGAAAEPEVNSENLDNTEQAGAAAMASAWSVQNQLRQIDVFFRTGSTARDLDRVIEAGNPNSDAQ
jgi:hypothetical protein